MKIRKNTYFEETFDFDTDNTEIINGNLNLFIQCADSALAESEKEISLLKKNGIRSIRNIANEIFKNR